ncbi:MAG: hypothetical protein ACFFD6_05885 [Candidatus Thorarchaeota archaeon]
MSNENPAITPPVVLESYEDFEVYAKKAALVTYSPEYFHSPFLEDEKRLRRITLTALGVMMNGVSFTFKHVMNYYDICDSTKSWDIQTREIDQFLNDMLSRLEAHGNLIRGSIEMEPAVGEALVFRP